MKQAMDFNPDRRKFLTQAGASAGLAAFSIFFGVNCSRNNELTRTFCIRQGGQLVLDEMCVKVDMVGRDGASLHIMRSRQPKGQIVSVSCQSFLKLGESIGQKFDDKHYQMSLLKISQETFTRFGKTQAMVQLEIKQSDD